MKKKRTFGSVSQWFVIICAGSSDTKAIHEGRKKRERWISKVERASRSDVCGELCELGHGTDWRNGLVWEREVKNPTTEREERQRERERESERVIVEIAYLIFLF